MKMGDQEQTIVNLKVNRRRRKQDPCHTYDTKVEHKGKKPEHRGIEMDAPAKFCKEPVKDLHASRDSNQDSHYSEKGVDIWTCAHCKKMVQPDDKREDSDDNQ